MNQNVGSQIRLRLLQRCGFGVVLSSLLPLCLVVIGALAGSPVQAEPMRLVAPAVGIAVVPSSVAVYVNEVFTLEIWVYPNGQQVDVVDADMTFNPDELAVLSITGDPSALPDELFSDFDNVAGTLTHSRGILVGTPPSTDFRLCSIELRAKAAIGGAMLAFTGLTGAFFGGEPVETETTDPVVIITVPVGGKARLPDPGRIAARWTVRLAVLTGLALGAVVILRKGAQH